MESGEINEKVYASPRPPPTISFKDNWKRIGFRSLWKQQRHPTNPTKTKNPIIKNGETRGWITSSPKRSRKISCLVTRTERPVAGQESTQVKEIHIDFRILGLSHAGVKEKENSSFSKAHQKDRKSSSSRSSSSRFCSRNYVSTTHSAIIRKR